MLVARIVARTIGLCILLTGTFTAHAEKTITLGTGVSMPPYVIADKERGIAVDLFRAAMQQAGLEVDVEYSDNAGVIRLFQQQAVDSIFAANPDLTPGAHFSELPLIVFHNQAIVLADSGIELQQLEALKPYRIGAFKLASKLLPAPFADIARDAEDYREYSMQLEQVQDLFRAERDVLVMDRTIFRYFLSQLRRQNPTSELYRQPFHYFDLFPKSRYYAVFKSAELKQAFDQGFVAIRNNGRYERILRTYQALLSDYLFR